MINKTPKIERCMICKIIILISFMIFSVCYASSSPAQSEVLILMYHSIEEKRGLLTPFLSASEFEEQMRILVEYRFETISLDDFVAYRHNEIELPQNPIILTFDDGYLDNYLYAFPILKKFGFTATFFLIADFIGDEAQGKYISWSQVIEMRRGGMSIGSHTLNHPYLTELTLLSIKAQLEDPKRIIEGKLGEEITSLAYPYGDFDWDIERLTKEAGYKIAVSSEPGMNDQDTSLFKLKRISIIQISNFEGFVSSLTRDEN